MPKRRHKVLRTRKDYEEIIPDVMKVATKIPKRTKKVLGELAEELRL